MRFLIITLIFTTSFGAIIHGVQRRAELDQGKITNTFELFKSSITRHTVRVLNIGYGGSAFGLDHQTRRIPSVLSLERTASVTLG